MTKKDFEAVAAAIKKVVDDSSTSERAALSRVVRELLPKLQATNPDFRRTTFIAACGLELRDVR